MYSEGLKLKYTAMAGRVDKARPWNGEKTGPNGPEWRPDLNSKRP